MRVSEKNLYLQIGIITMICSNFDVVFCTPFFESTPPVINVRHAISVLPESASNRFVQVRVYTTD